jgi:hypothetical protein
MSEEKGVQDGWNQNFSAIVSMNMEFTKQLFSPISNKFTEAHLSSNPEFWFINDQNGPWLINESVVYWMKLENRAVVRDTEPCFDSNAYFWEEARTLYQTAVEGNAILCVSYEKGSQLPHVGNKRCLNLNVPS